MFQFGDRNIGVRLNAVIDARYGEWGVVVVVVIDGKNGFEGDVGLGEGSGVVDDGGECGVECSLATPLTPTPSTTCPPFPSHPLK